MKKEISSIIIALCVLIVFLGGFALGNTRGISVNIGAEFDVNGVENSVVEATQAAVVTTTAAAVTTTLAADTSVDTQVDTSTDAEADDSTQEETTEAETSTSLPSTTAEIAALYNNLINDLKTVDYVEVVKEQDLPVSVTECSISFATSLVEIAMNAVLSADSWSDTFTNGVSSSGRTLSSSISPYDRECVLTADALSSATCTENSDGGYTITLQFIEETSSFDGVSNTPESTYHQQALDPIDLSTMDIPAAEILSADMYYSGAYVELDVDADGNVTRFYSDLPLEGSGIGKLSVFEPTVGIAGYTETTFTFTY